MNSVAFLIFLVSFLFYAPIFGQESDVLDEAKPATIIGNDGVPTTPIISPETMKTEEISAVSEPTLEEGPPALFTLEEMKGLNVKKLKEFLKVRGLECKGCSEKDDFVKMAMKNQQLPILSATNKPPAADSKESVLETKDNEKVDPAEMDDLMAKLRSQGFGGQFWNTNDFKDKSPEEIAERMQRQQQGRYPGAKVRPKKTSSNAKSGETKSSGSKKGSSGSKKSSSSNKKSSKSSSSSSSKPKKAAVEDDVVSATTIDENSNSDDTIEL